MNDGFCRECSRPMPSGRSPSAAVCSRACRRARKFRLRHRAPTQSPPCWPALSERCPQHVHARLAFATDGWGHTVAGCPQCGWRPVLIRGARFYDQCIDTRLEGAGRPPAPRRG